MTALQVALTSWSSLFPQISFLLIFFIPLFSIQVIYHAQWKGWLLYFFSVSFIQLLILAMPWDWFLLFIFPSMVIGLYLGFVTLSPFHESILFAGGTLIQMMLFWGVNWLSDQLYNVNYTGLIQQVFSIPLNDHVNLFYLGLYLASLLQFFTIWIVYRYVLQSQKITKLHIFSPRNSIFSILVLLIIYVLLYLVFDLPFLWLVGPLVFLSVIHMVQVGLSLSKKWQYFVIILGLFYPITHALIATYTALWAFPISLLWLPFLALVMTFISHSPSQEKIG